jgi:DNA mismatch repair protein MutS
MLIDDYINYTNEYKKLYEKCLVLMQVGSFYELYGVGECGADVDTVCDILEIQSTRKNKSISIIDKSNPKMAGLPLFVLDKYLDILLDNSYTIVIVEQTTKPPNPKREVTRVISPATRNIEQSVENNYLMCLYFTTGSSKNGKFIVASIAYLDVNTNKSYIFETSESDTKLNLEDVFKTIYNNKPSEIAIFTDIRTKSNTEFMVTLSEYISQLSIGCIHNKLLTAIDESFFKLPYQRTVLEKVFKNRGMLSVIEFLNLESHPTSVTCYTYLIQFIYEHNEKMLEGLNQPIFLDNNKYLSLVNNVVENLNIINTNSNTKTSSVHNLLNNCKTAIGKRYFKQCLLNPLTNTSAIEKRYELCDYFTQNDLYISCRALLDDISDLERIFKRILIGSIQPTHFIQLNKSLISVKTLHRHLTENKCKFSDLNWTDLLQQTLDEFINYYQSRLNFEEIETTSMLQITKNIFNKGVHEDLDRMQENIVRLENIFENVCLCLNEGNENNTEFKLEVSKGKSKDKIVRTIVVTKNRFENMMKDKKRYTCVDNLLKERCNIGINDIKTEPFSSSNKTTLKIIFKDMGVNQVKLIELQNEFSQKVFDYYMSEVEYYKNEYSSIFNNITEFISKLDFFCNNAKNAVEKCYVRPIIVEGDESFIKAEKIRHPLIEVIQTDVPYIANDIEIGTENKKGMLLYGLNSIGKSSFMKSVGINLILAQAGLYVACKSFEFSPYDHIFSRIPGGDNLFKNQSTFVVEINELRTILKKSTNRSLIIGDELASGTENTSAISLVASGIMTLSKKESSFIFATHLHEICEIECIKNLKNVSVNHLSVHFDPVKNCLVFDRILKDGNGDMLYGLEIAKSLDLPADFLLIANQIRQEYTDMKKIIVEPKTSAYSKLVFMDKCGICDKNCTEVHHIKEQKFADSKGIFRDEQIHKNRRSNLVAICEECHKNVHKNGSCIKGYEQTTNGIVLHP